MIYIGWKVRKALIKLNINIEKTMDDNLQLNAFMLSYVDDRSVSDM